MAWFRDVMNAILGNPKDDEPKREWSLPPPPVREPQEEENIVMSFTVQDMITLYSLLEWHIEKKEQLLSRLNIPGTDFYDALVAEVHRLHRMRHKVYDRLFPDQGED